MHRTVGVVLAYLNHYVYTWFVVIPLLLADQLVPGSNLLVCLLPVVYCCWLAITIIIAYLINSDGNAPGQKKQEVYHQAGRLWRKVCQTGAKSCLKFLEVKNDCLVRVYSSNDDHYITIYNILLNLAPRTLSFVLKSGWAMAPLASWESTYGHNSLAIHSPSMHQL